MRKNLNILSLAFFVLGIFFFINSKLNITGAIIGSSNIPSIFSSIFGLVFILVSVLIFASGKSLDNKLEEVEKAEVENGEPIILDTNYLIGSCKDEKGCKKLKEFIQSNFDCGQPVIIPKKVYNELRIIGNNKGEINRMANLKEFLSKHTFPMENIDEKWENSRERYNNLAKGILYQTPKYLAFMYLSKIKNKENISIDKFLNSNFSKLSDAFSREKYRYDIETAIRTYDKASSGERKNILHNYDVSPADMEVLSSALYLQDYPSMIADKTIDKVKIITKDAHLLDSLDILNKSYATRRGKLKVMEKI